MPSQPERYHTSALSAGDRRAILDLCAAAYEEDLSPYLEWIGDGIHLFVRDGAGIVSHVMVVERWLQQHDRPMLRTGYIELVATHPDAQGRGLASLLMRAAAEEIAGYELGALSPSDAAFYERLGWERWHGPLSVRTDHGHEATPDEEIMVRRTPRTPGWLDAHGPLSCEWRAGEVW